MHDCRRLKQRLLAMFTARLPAGQQCLHLLLLARRYIIHTPNLHNIAAHNSSSYTIYILLSPSPVINGQPSSVRVTRFSQLFAYYIFSPCLLHETRGMEPVPVTSTVFICSAITFACDFYTPI